MPPMRKGVCPSRRSGWSYICKGSGGCVLSWYEDQVGKVRGGGAFWPL